MDKSIVLLTDREIERGAGGRVTNYGDINLKVIEEMGTTSLRSFIPSGLYDPRIFGSLNQCVCKRTDVVDVACVQCGCIVKDEEGYQRSYGYYKCAYPYISDIKLKGFVNKIKSILPIKGKGLADLWSLSVEILPIDPDSMKEDSAEVYLTRNGRYYSVSLGEIPEIDEPNQEDLDLNFFGLMGLLSLSDYSVVNGESLDWIKSYINYNLIITSPAVRPYSKKDKLTLPMMTINYRAVIHMDKTLPTLINENYTKVVDRLTLCFAMNSLINTMMGENELLLTSKASFIRNIVDTRVAKSFRASIVSAPDLKVNQMYVPTTLIYKALQLDIIEELLKTEGTESQCIQMYRDQAPRAKEICHELAGRSMCTMIRNPSLHRFSVQAFHPIIWDEIAIGVPPAVCEAYNADFDGDTAYLQFYTDPIKSAEMKDITPDKLWFYDVTHKSQLIPRYDLLYGLHLATRLREPSKGMKAFKDLESAKQAYLKADINVDEVITINDRKTSYGRAHVSSIVDLDLDTMIGNDSINIKTASKLISAMGYHPDRVNQHQKLIKFAAEVCTLEGFGPVPFQELFKEDSEKVKAILSSDDTDMNKVNQLNEFCNKRIKETINELPNSNLPDLLKASGKVSVGKLVQVYAPAISLDNLGAVMDGDSIFKGLSERTYNNMAYQNRMTLKMKQDLVPIGGYVQRQMVNLCLSLIYSDKLGSPDNEGIFLEGVDAVGRTDLQGNIITAPKQGLVRVKSCINNPTNIVYKDEVAARDFEPYLGYQGRKIFAQDGSAIGVTFGSALAEGIIQNGLGFKHGGSLESTERTDVYPVEPGVVEEVTSRFVTVKGAHTYKYLITESCTLMSDIKEGVTVSTDTVLFIHDLLVKADFTISCINTVIKTELVSSVGLGNYQVESPSTYTATSGILEWDGKNNLVVGGRKYQITEDYVYKYPLGYHVDRFTRLNNGVPSMTSYSDIPVADQYFIFWNYLRTLSPFSSANSEALEILFKCIFRSSFSIKKGISDKDSFVDRLYYGNTISNFKDEINRINHQVNEKGDTEARIKLNEGIILPMILGNRYIK